MKDHRLGHPGVIALLAFLGCGAVIGQVDEVEGIHRALAAELVVLSQECKDQRLFNMSEGMLLEARAWGGTEQWRLVVDRRIKAVRAARQAQRTGDRLDEFRGFLKSKRHDVIHRTMVKKRGKLDESMARRALLAACAAVGGDRPDEARRAFEFVARVDPHVARRLAGSSRQLWERVRREHVDGGLAKLKLGVETSRLDVSVQELAGKVVLWRSKSL